MPSFSAHVSSTIYLFEALYCSFDVKYGGIKSTNVTINCSHMMEQRLRVMDIANCWCRGNSEVLLRCVIPVVLS
jgi:hypothetical protein